ncbi:MAG: complex I subunit 5 family protein [Halapricum sp.]
MSNYVVAPMLVALLTAIATLAVRSRPRLQQGVSLLGGLAYVGAVAYLVYLVFTGPILTYQLSEWVAPYGITLVADQLSGFVLAMSAVVTLAALVFSIVYVDEFGQQVSYHPLFHFMLVGVTGAFLTGDVFNLFVWFEVMLMPSYVLVVFYSGPQHTRAALQYTMLNLVGSAVMLLSIGGLYATTGTLNMADLAVRLANPDAFGISLGPVVGLAALLFAVFALKAGLVPFHFWVPNAYEAAPAPVSAMLSGVTKKVGIYAIVRLLFTVFGAAHLDMGPFGHGSMVHFFGPILLVMAVASMFLGGYAAVGQPNFDRLLAYSSIGQVGFIVLPLAIVATVPASGATASITISGHAYSLPVGFVQSDLHVLGIVATLLYALNHAIAKSLLFLVSGAVSESVGTIDLGKLGGLTRERPFLSGAFLLGGLSLVGIPPLMGFFGKLFVFNTATRAVAAGNDVGTIAAVAALIGAIFTIAYVSKAWNRAFWGSPSPEVKRATQPTALIAIVVAMALLLVVLGVGLDPIYGAAHGAAHAAVDRQAYVRAVGLSYEVTP